MLDGARGSKKERKTGQTIATIIVLMIIRDRKQARRSINSDRDFEPVDKRVILTPHVFIPCGED